MVAQVVGRRSSIATIVWHIGQIGRHVRQTRKQWVVVRMSGHLGAWLRFGFVQVLSDQATQTKNISRLKRAVEKDNEMLDKMKPGHSHTYIYALHCLHITHYTLFVLFLFKPFYKL